jgi:plasmid stabilization system protein ParE
VKVLYSPRSLRDLMAIRDFIAVESGSRKAAGDYIAQLLDASDSLVSLPERYPPYRFAAGWRMMPFENYLVFFQVKNDEVRVGHFRHGARRPFRGQ